MERHKKQINLTNLPQPLPPKQQKTQKKKFYSHEYGNISQRSQRLFEEPQLLFRAINSTNNCSLALRLSVCLLYHSMNMVTDSMQLPPQVPGWTDISIGNGNT